MGVGLSERYEKQNAQGTKLSPGSIQSAGETSSAMKGGKNYVPVQKRGLLAYQEGHMRKRE